MVRILLACGLVVLLAGCAREEDYFEIAREQRAAMKEVTDVLVTVTDDASMAAAKQALDEKAKKCEAIAQKARSMSRPSPEVQARLREDSHLTEGVVNVLRKEAARVSKLPGGPAFLKQFESTSLNLSSAVQK